MIGPGSDKKWPLPYANSKSKEVIFFAKSPYYCNPKFWMFFMKLFLFVESLKKMLDLNINIFCVFLPLYVTKSILLLPKVDSNQLRYESSTPTSIELSS